MEEMKRDFLKNEELEELANKINKSFIQRYY